MTFTTSHWVNGQKYIETIEAESWVEAEKICRRRMRHLDGRVALSVTVRVPFWIAYLMARLIAWLTW